MLTFLAFLITCPYPPNVHSFGQILAPDFFSNVIPTLPKKISDRFSKHIFYPKWFMYMYLYNAFDVGILPRMPSECTILVLFTKKIFWGRPPRPPPMGGVDPSHTHPTCAPPLLNFWIRPCHQTKIEKEVSILCNNMHFIYFFMKHYPFLYDTLSISLRRVIYLSMTVQIPSVSSSNFYENWELREFVRPPPIITRRCSINP